LARRWSVLVLFIIVLAIWALQIIAYGALTRSDLVDTTAPAFVTFWRSFPPFRLPEFSFGLLSGRLLLTGRLAGRQTVVRWSAAAAFALILLISARPGLVPGALEVSLLAPLFALVIFALGSGALPTFEWLNGPVPVLLGRASYAVYILHQPFKTLFLAIAKRVGLDSPSAGLLIAYLIVLELTCIGLFHWFEDPLRRLITRAPSTSSRQ
jgi:peptidoglycan/LPS O-acetylase OafA/YrhL